MKRDIVLAIVSVVFVVGLAPAVSAQTSKNATYIRFHGVQIFFDNAKVTAVSNGVAVGNTAIVGPGASITVEADYSFLFSPDPNAYASCPGCIIQNYVGWMSPAAAAGASPINLGLWSGQSISPGSIFTGQGATSGHFVFNTTAPTTQGEYRIGCGETFDFDFVSTAPGTGGYDTAQGLGGPQIFGSFLISVVSLPPTNCPGDGNDDGVVNFADITDVLANWLSICP